MKVGAEACVDVEGLGSICDHELFAMGRALGGSRALNVVQAKAFSKISARRPVIVFRFPRVVGAMVVQLQRLEGARAPG